jgi:protein DJ-1
MPRTESMTSHKPRVLVLLADGAEEMEVVITVDVLRRAGIEVVVAGLDGPNAVTCSRGVRLLPDAALATTDTTKQPFDVLVLPGGGEGSRRLASDRRVGALLKSQEAAQRTIAAICAAPSALAAHGEGAGRSLTSHPGVEAEVAAHGRYRTDAVVVDGPFVTSRGPGTAFEFALAIAARLVGREAAESLRAPMML